MNTAAVPESILAIDVGEINTRAYLFEIVEHQYRFIAQSIAPTSVPVPVMDIMPGVIEAIRGLEEITSRKLIGAGEKLLFGSAGSGQGVDGLAATISAGGDIKVVCAGLLANLSLESASHLASTTYARVYDTLSATDPRKMDEQIDSFIRILPDIVIVTGGTEMGASRSVRNVLETIRAACAILPRDKRPDVLFAGNSALAETVKKTIGSQAPIIFTSNIRPTPESESLDPAQNVFAEMTARVKSRQLTGAQNLYELSSNRMMTTSASFGRMIRFLGMRIPSLRGVVGLDLGSTGTTLAVGKSNQLTQHFSRWSGEGYINAIQNWIPGLISNEQIKEYLLFRSSYPASIPSTIEELNIAHAIARVRIQHAIKAAAVAYPQLELGYADGLNFGFDQIIISGTTLTGSPDLAAAMAVILDGFQPAGITSIFLDQSNLLPVLGACGQLAPALPGEVLDNNPLQALGTVISPVNINKRRTHLLKVRIEQEGKQDVHIDIGNGDFLVVPLNYGQFARLHIDLDANTELGIGGKDRHVVFRVTGGLLGLIFDARGHPIKPPKEPEQRCTLLNHWHTALKG